MRSDDNDDDVVRIDDDLEHHGGDDDDIEIVADGHVIVRVGKMKIIATSCDASMIPHFLDLGVRAARELLEMQRDRDLDS